MGMLNSRPVIKESMLYAMVKKRYRGSTVQGITVSEILHYSRKH